MVKSSLSLRITPRAAKSKPILEAIEFLRCLILFHVMPEGFHTIQYAGFLGNKVRDEKLAHCRRLLGMPVAGHDATPKASQKGCHAVTFQAMRFISARAANTA